MVFKGSDMSSIGRGMPEYGSDNWSGEENVDSGTPENSGTPTPLAHTPTQQSRPETGGPDANQLAQTLSSLQRGNSPIERLPNELLRKVVDELPAGDVLNKFALTSRGFNRHLDAHYKESLKASARLESAPELSGQPRTKAPQFERRLNQLDSARQRPGDGDHSQVLVDLAQNTDLHGITGTDSVSKLWGHVKKVPTEHPRLPEMLELFNPAHAPENKREEIRNELVSRLEQTVKVQPHNEDADLAVRRQAMLFVRAAENSQDINSRAAISKRFLEMDEAVRNAEGRGIKEPERDQLRIWSS
jgi:hypothetical protein